MSTPSSLVTPHGRVPLPSFFPDGTRGVVRSVDADDLATVGVGVVVMNAFHLMTKPGVRTIRQIGGLHRFTGWQGPILTDSGGFQIYSLLRGNPENGVVRSREVIFRQNGEKVVLTPEKCIRLQFQLGADIMTCLDWCTHPDDPVETTRESVNTTIRWGNACRNEFDARVERLGEQERPRLFGIIQGGRDLNERKRCAEALLELGFDGYGFGGWPLDAEGHLLTDLLAFTAELMPDDLPKYALGVGKPESVVACVKMGYTLLDSVIPTRDARHKRLYVFNAARLTDVNLDDRFYETLYMQDDRHVVSAEPVSVACDCLLCRRYTRAYLHHLFRVNDALALRLATLHNLRFYMQLMDMLRNRHGA